MKDVRFLKKTGMQIGGCRPHAEAEKFRAEIDGEGSAWKLPLDKVISPPTLNSDSRQVYEPPPPGETVCCLGRVRAKREQRTGLLVLLPQSQGLNLVLTVSHVTFSVCIGFRVFWFWSRGLSGFTERRLTGGALRSVPPLTRSWPCPT